MASHSRASFTSHNIASHKYNVTSSSYYFTANAYSKGSTSLHHLCFLLRLAKAPATSISFNIARVLPSRLKPWLCQSKGYTHITKTKLYPGIINFLFSPKILLLYPIHLKYSILQENLPLCEFLFSSTLLLSTITYPPSWDFYVGMYLMVYPNLQTTNLLWNTLTHWKQVISTHRQSPSTP